MADSEKLEIIITVVDKATGAVKTVASSIQKNLGRAVKAGVAGFAALTAGIGFSVLEAMNAEKSYMGLSQVIKSTGGVAGVTERAARDLASELQNVTKYADTIIVRGETLLLTFTNIGQDVFPQATEAMLNMAEMFGSVDQAAIQLGKALNDPIQGVAALRRVGVQLTETQEDQIKMFMEMGNISAAQKVILGELETQMGGYARAMGDTFGGQLARAKNAFGDFFKMVGLAATPALKYFNDQVLIPAATSFGNFGTAIFEAMEFYRDFDGLVVSAASTQKMQELFGPKLGMFIRDTIGMVMVLNNELGENGTSAMLDRLFRVYDNGQSFMGNLVYSLAQLHPMWELSKEDAWAVGRAITGVGEAIRELLAEQVKPFIEKHGPAFRGAFKAIGAFLGSSFLLGAIASVTIALMGLFGPMTLILIAVGLLGAAWEENWGGIRTFTEKFWTETLRPFLEDLYEWLQVHIPIAIERLSVFWENTLRPFLIGMADAINTYVIPAIRDIVNWFGELFSAFEQGGLEGGFKFLAEAGKQMLVALAEGMGDLAVWVYENLIVPLGDAIVAYVNSGRLEKDLIKLGLALWDMLKKGIRAIGNFMTWVNNEFIVPLAQAFAAYVQSGQLREDLEKLGEAIWEGLKAGINAIGEFSVWVFDNVIDPLAAAFAEYVESGQMWEDTKKLGSSILAGLKDGIEMNITITDWVLSEVIVPLGQAFLSYVGSGQLAEDLKTLGVSIFKNIAKGKDLIGEMAVWVATRFIIPIGRGFLLAAGEITNILKGIGGGIWGGIKKGFSEALQEAIQDNWFVQQANILKDQFESILQIRSPSKVFEKMGQQVGAGLQLGIGKSMGISMSGPQMIEATSGFASNAMNRGDFSGFGGGPLGNILNQDLNANITINNPRQGIGSVEQDISHALAFARGDL